MATTSTHPSEAVLRRTFEPDPVGLLELWRHEGPRTLRTFRVFADVDLGFRPQRGARSIAELLQHVTRSYRLTEHLLFFDTLADLQALELPSSVTVAANSLRDAQAGLFATLEGLPASLLLTEIAPFGRRESRAVMALGMLKHEIHHRGELYALARVCGRNPCNLYDVIKE